MLVIFIFFACAFMFNLIIADILINIPYFKMHLVNILYYCKLKFTVYYNCLHSEKSPVRPMLFYSTNYWHHF